jgi:hypothetical protein
MRPLMRAEPILRAGRPETVLLSNFTARGAWALAGLQIAAIVTIPLNNHRRGNIHFSRLMG